MNTRELGVLVLLCVIWGFHYVVIKFAVADIPPIFYAAMRMTIVAACMAPFLRWRPGMMGPVLLAAVCFGAFNYVFLFHGVKYATASTSAIANELYVPFATILSVIFLKEKIGWRRIVGISLAFAGVAVIALSRDAATMNARIGLGVGLVALATLIEATGAILVKKASGFKPWELLAWFGLVGSLVLWPLTALLERGQLEALAASDGTMIAGAVLYSAVLSSIFGHTTYYWLIQRRPVSQVAVSTLLTTMLAVGFSIAILGDPFTFAFAIGGAMTLVGVGIVVLRAPRTAPEPGAPEVVVAIAAEEAKT